MQRARFFDALGSAREALVQLECAEAAGYVEAIDRATRNRFDHVIGVLVKLTR